MGAIAVQTHSALRFHSLSCFTNKPKFGNPIFSPRDVRWSVEGNGIRLTVSCVGSDGNRRDRPMRRSSTSSRKKASEDEEDERSPDDDRRPNSSSQEDIIAIFRRIQSSISKDEPVKHNATNANASEEKSRAASILKVLGESRKKQGRAKNEEVNDKTATRIRNVSKKEKGRQDYSQVTGSKLYRPPSKFAKRSPIPSPTNPRGISVELKNERSLTAAGEEEESDRARLEAMKLAELKELAKSRGIKGYSKLKKSELFNLLKS